MLLRVLHTGIAVDNLEQSITLYESIGYKVVNKFHKPEPSAEVATVQNGDVAVELWKFESFDHPYTAYIGNHIAFYSDNLDEDIQSMQSKGYKVVIPITDGVLLRYAFVQDASGATYEIATNK